MSSIKKLIILKNISGKNDKQQFIKDNVSDEYFMEMLWFLLNPYVTTGISKQKIKKTLNCEYENLTNLDEAMHYLKHNNTGKDIHIATIQAFLKKYDKEERSILELLFTKQLKLGVTSKTVNKVVKGYIPEFSPMLAKKFSDIKNIDKLASDGITITEKLDGIRCLAVVENNNVKLCSRQGKEFIGLHEIEEEYSNYPNGVYDGELLAFANDNELTEDLFRRTLSLVNNKELTTGVEHVVFDYIPLEDFMQGYSKYSYKNRRELLENTNNTVKKDKKTSKTRTIRVLNSLYFGNDINKIPILLNTMDSQGKEGIMINFNNSPYECKRSSGLLKAKKFDSADLFVIGVTEGDGKYKNMLGTITVDYKGFPLEIGSGFTDNERKLLWENPHKVINHIVEVAYQNESQNKDGGYSLRFATFKGIREDKGKEDVRYSDSDK